MYMYVYMQEEEFSRSLDLSGKSLYGGDTVFVVWKWSWTDYDIDYSSSSELCTSQSATSTRSSESDSEVISNRSAEIPAITHSVVFKCIGSTKESSYQDALFLAKSKMRLGQSVPVRLINEPNNPKDSRAIAFECKPADQYIRIGYIVHEALDAVHDAIDQDKIVRVSFDYVKFVVQFKAWGWYAGIIITRQGEWPAHVLRCRAKSFIS